MRPWPRQSSARVRAAWSPRPSCPIAGAPPRWPIACWLPVTEATSAGPGPESSMVLLAVPGMGEIEPGTDLCDALAAAMHPAAPHGPELRDGDVLVVTQKVVSKAEGRLVPVDPDDPSAKIALVERE